MRIILLLLFSIQLLSQTKKLDTVFCDCSKAKALTINSRTIYGKTIAPQGSGEIQEISPVKQKTRFAFEEEHNSAWYKLIINENGELTMHITPLKANDDYDFMLFKASKTNFCDSLQKYKINPVRACISRDKEELNGKTGINFKSTKDLIKHGFGEAYCRSLAVKKGEVYYLVLDNVYDKGEGHLLEFEISEAVLFKGIIIDDNSKGINADVTLTNRKGDTIALEKTEKDGSYNFTAFLTKKQFYNLNFYNDSSFSFTKGVSIDDTLQLKALSTILPKLKKGRKYSIGSINFIGGSVQYLPRAIPAMNNLAKLLKKNPGLKIKIIGHMNGMTMDENHDISFTKSRARTIRNYLAIQGIDEKRIQINGRGGHEMLVEAPRTNDEAEQNRRVEIEVLEY